MKGAGSANQLAEPGKGILLSVEIQNCGKELNHLKFQMKLGFMNLAWAATLPPIPTESVIFVLFVTLRKFIFQQKMANLI